MTTPLQTDNVPLVPVPLTPVTTNEVQELREIVWALRNYVAALQKDVAKLRDLNDTYHP